ncbi:hypothetical protein HK097_006716 [Rhizophlyctis rosea]|uniref:Uncharacterized protein n=1 Tax=Rhizophlyctis rosea TaxID=64517 RepID=A0AAD5WYE5_9FUNG|nr:hypothetical protein HK097_006716 [Rhizophlyctis rosea]
MVMPVVDNIFNPLKRQAGWDGLRKKDGSEYADKANFAKRLKGLDVATDVELVGFFDRHFKPDDMPADVLFKEFKTLMTSIPPEYAGPVVRRFLGPVKEWRQATITECNKISAENRKNKGKDGTFPDGWIHFRVIVHKFYERFPYLQTLCAQQDLSKEDLMELKFWAFIAFFFFSVRTCRNEGVDMLAAEDLTHWKAKKGSEMQPITYSDGTITVWRANKTERAYSFPLHADAKPLIDRLVRYHQQKGEWRVFGVGASQFSTNILKPKFGFHFGLDKRPNIHTMRKIKNVYRWQLWKAQGSKLETEEQMVGLDLDHDLKTAKETYVKDAWCDPDFNANYVF